MIHKHTNGKEYKIVPSWSNIFLPFNLKKVKIYEVDDGVSVFIWEVFPSVFTWGEKDVDVNKMIDFALRRHAEKEIPDPTKKFFKQLRQLRKHK